MLLLVVFMTWQVSLTSMNLRFGGTWNEMVRSWSDDTLSPLNTFVVGVQSMKSSVLSVAVTFWSRERPAWRPLIFRVGFMNTVHVEPTRTDSSLRWN